LVKIAKFLALATLIIAPALATGVPAMAQAPAAASSPAMPDSWDAKIPLPPGAVLIDSTVPKAGVVHSANFAVTQDYQGLVDFYLKELPKAKFVIGPKLAAPARKVYDLSFIKGDMLDNLTISPSDKDPSKMNLHIAWTPDSAKKKPAAP
jgi:hypothetical protein